jgi:tyrosyl-tRNA synthetase
MPLLVGLDGVKKMSKSYGNFIALNDEPNEMFGKAMRVSDELMIQYYELLTDADLATVKAEHPMKAKKTLARTLVERFHGTAAADAALAYFENTFSKKELPKDLVVVKASKAAKFSEIVLSTGAVKSKGEAQRLIVQGGVKIDGAKASDMPAPAPGSFVLQVGKHQFFRIELIP